MFSSGKMSDRIGDMIRDRVREEIYAAVGTEIEILREALGGSPVKAAGMAISHFTAGETINGSSLSATEAFQGARSVAANIANQNFLGAALDIFSMYKQYNDGVRAPLSGVDPIFGEGIDLRSVDLASLTMDSILSRATFSSRNADHELFNAYAGLRTGVDNVIGGARDFEESSEDAWVKTSKLNEMAGIPRRTNFNHG